MKLLTLTLKPVNKIVTIFFKKKIVTTLVSQNTLNRYKKYISQKKKSIKNIIQ